jgi:hypothetical protein
VFDSPCIQVFTINNCTHNKFLAKEPHLNLAVYIAQLEIHKLKFIADVTRSTIVYNQVEC